jgi:hypothetical protein
VRFVQLDEWFEAIGDKHDELFAGFERELAGVNQRLDKIERRVTSIERRIS